MKNKRFKKAISLVLSVLMLMSCWVWVAPTDASAAGTYYVRVYVNIYDGSDGTANAYSVNSTGKPNNYSWATNAGYYGDVNMHGMTLFTADGSYYTKDLNADLVDVQSNSNAWYDMSDVTIDNCDSVAVANKVYNFTVNSIPTELFWIVDENNGNGDTTAYAIRKITVAASSDTTEHVLWEGLSGGSSKINTFYGIITPGNIHTPWDDWSANSDDTYKAITTSSSSAWTTTSTPKTVQFTNGTTINYTVPRIDVANDDSSKFTRGAKVYDQYGVDTGITPTYYVTDAEGNVLNNTSIYYDGSAIRVRKTLQTLYPATTTNTFYLVADYNGITDRLQLNLTNPTYTVTYKDANGNTVATHNEVYGTVITSPASGTGVATDNGDGTHTIDGYPKTVTVVGDRVLTLNGTEAHIVESYVTIKPATYVSAGKEQGECVLCGATVTREIPQLTHDEVIPLKNAITSFESKLKNGASNFYQDMTGAYNAYNDAQRYYDAVVYGGVTYNATTAQNYITALQNALSTYNETYIDYLNQTFYSRNGSAINKNYTKNLIWNGYDFSWDITTGAARWGIWSQFYNYWAVPNTIIGITSERAATFPVTTFFFTSENYHYMRYIIGGSGTNGNVVGTSVFTPAVWKVSNSTHTTSDWPAGADGWGDWAYDSNVNSTTIPQYEVTSHTFKLAQKTIYQASTYMTANNNAIGVNASNLYNKTPFGITWGISDGSTTQYKNGFADSSSVDFGYIYAVYMDPYRLNYKNWQTLIPSFVNDNYNGYAYSSAITIAGNLDSASNRTLTPSFTESNRKGNIDNLVSSWSATINGGATDLATAQTNSNNSMKITSEYNNLIAALSDAEAMYQRGYRYFTPASWSVFETAYKNAKNHMAALNPNGTNAQYSSDSSSIGSLATTLKNATAALEYITVTFYNTNREEMAVLTAEKDEVLIGTTAEELKALAPANTAAEADGNTMHTSYVWPAFSNVTNKAIYEETAVEESHKWNGDYVVTQNPTCSTPGSKHRVCTVCGYDDIQSIDTIAHDYEIMFDENGHWLDCKVCDAVTQSTAHTLDYSSIEGTDKHTVFCTYENAGETCGYTAEENHDWNEGEITSAPDCNNDGVKTLTCKKCDATKTEAITSEGHKFEITDNGDGTHINKCSVCGAVDPDAVAEAHTYSYQNNNDGTHTVNCDVCGLSATIDHIFANPVLARPTESDGVWTDGTYTYTCVCGETKIEAAERADYSALENAVAELEALKENNELTDDATAEVEEALTKAKELAEDLVTAEQDQIDALVKELQNVKTDVEEAINKEIGINHVTEANSGIKVQFLKKTGVDAIESVQLDANGGFETVRMRISNGNADLPVTVTKVVAEKAYIGATDAADSDTYATATVINVKDSADLYIVAPAAFNEAGIITYTITYTIDGLKDADGNAVVFETKAYLYVKAAGYNPHHYMDEKVGVGSETSEWDFYLEATNYGDFELVYDNKAPYDAFGNDNLVQDGAGLFDYVREQYDYENDACYAGCANGSYDDGDAHAATYRFYIDTSLAPTWEDAGLRARLVENEAGFYTNAPIKYIRLANNQEYLDRISGTDKTFSVTFLPSASGTQGMTWTATSNGAMTVSQYDNPDQNDYIFGYHHPNEGCEETTAYANFAGAIPQNTTEAKLMFSPRMEFNGPNFAFAEAVTMTTHLYITSYDKAELREAVSAAEQAGYNNKYYADKQYEAYENALKNAKEVLGKAETNQNEVDEATRQLEAAIENLVKAENEARFVLTVTHSIHDGADRNSENPDVSNKDYYLIATNESVEAALLSAEVLEGYTVNKHDAIAFFAIEDGKDTEKEYHYWYIDYSDVQDAIDAADEIIKNKDDYNEDFINDVTEKKEALEDILEGKDDTTTPESQGTVDDAIKDATELTGHTHNEDVIIPAQAPSCTFDGLTEGAKCSECGMITKAQTTVNASGHNFRTIAAKAATCLAPGNVEYKQCTVCNLFFAADAEVTAENGVGSTASFVLKQLDHSYTGEYKWNNAGEIKYHSQKCVNGCGEYGPEEACDFVSVETSAPTCTVGGTITHTCKVCHNSYDTYTSANGHSWSNWELKTAPTAETDGTYIRTCQVCNTTEEKSVKREDYSAYDEAVKKAEELLNDEKLTPEAKQVIQNALDEANKLDQKLPADVVEDGKTIIDNANDEIINAAAGALNNALDSLYDENGKLKSEYEKVDYTNYDNAVGVYETIKDTMTAEDKAAVEAIKAEIEKIPADASKKDYQEQVDKAATDIAAINAKYGNCATGNHTWGNPVLTTAPTADSQGEYTETCDVCGATQITKVDLADYDEFDKAVEKLENLLGTENLTDEAKQAIENALEKAEELDKNLPADVTTVDGKEIKGGQDEIDALVTELEKVVADTNADIADGSALKPDYEAWETAEGAYDALDKTNVKSEVITEANALKAEIAAKQADDTLTQATATQTDINNATTRLNEIIAGITDGSLKYPDYSAVEEKLEQANNAEGLNKDTQDKIEEIEKALEEIKGRTEPEANYRDNQDEVNALETQLNEILDKIANDSATVPDYTEWDKAEGTYTAIDKTHVSDELVEEAANLKAAIDALKADDTANAKDDQQTINNATTRLNEIITEINGILTEKPDYSGYDTSHDAYEKLVEQYGDKIKDGVADDVTALDTIVDGVRNDETSTKVDDQGTVDDAKTALDAIIDGIKDGSLRDPDYSDVEDKLEDANNATGLNQDTQSKIDAIENALAAIKGKTEPEANAKDDQTAVDNLEAELDEILDSITNGTATAPDYTKWDAAEGSYDALDKTNISETLINEATGLKNTIDALKADNTANAKDDQQTINDATTRLNEIITEINGILTEKPDYSGYDTSHDAYEKLVEQYGDKIKDGVADEITALDTIVDGVRNDETSTKVDDQGTVDNAKTALDAIIDGINDGSLRDPDYSAVEDKIDEAKDNGNLNKDTQDKIKDIEEELQKIKDKTEPEANAKDDQPAVDALEDQLDEILDSIANGTATAPDYTEWDNAEGEYTGLNKTDVKDDILKEAEELKKVIDALKDDPTANATEDQKTVTDAADRLNDIIDGITDGSLKDPDYSDVEDKLEDAKDATGLNKDTQDKIDAIEKALEEIKNKEPEANARDDQDDVKALEDQLDEILEDIENGTAIKPDYSEAEKAIQDAESIDGISDADKAIVDELKKQLEDIKNNPESNKTEHQDDVDDIKDAALELVEKYESICLHEGTEKKYTTNVADDKKQSTHTVQCLRCGEVIGTENCSFRTEIVAATCRSEGYTIYTCEGCKLSFKDDFTDPAAHNYSEWRVKEGSCKTANTKTRYCLNPGCMAEQTETVIGADGKPVYGAHTFVIVKGSEATCLNDGYTDYSRCIVCNEVTESKVIPAKGHVDNNHNGNCDECSQLINPSGHCSCFCHGDSFFEKLLFRFVNFFWKLFKINPICECGTKHW